MECNGWGNGSNYAETNMYLHQVPLKQDDMRCVAGDSSCSSLIEISMMQNKLSS
jgi:hypothetical protein